MLNSSAKTEANSPQNREFVAPLNYCVNSAPITEQNVSFEPEQDATPELAIDTPINHRIYELDGLRAVAFLTVFLFHLGAIQGYTRGPVFVYNELIHWCFLGVDLFFVISGYIITKLLLQEKQQFGVISIKRFFQRRVIRIWPLYFLTVAISIFGILLFAKRNFDFELFGKILADVYLPISFFWYIMPQSSNVAIAALTEQTRFPIIHSIAPLWSVCVEEQFYLIWPWCVAFVRGRRQLLFILLAMVTVSELSRATGFPAIPGFFYHNPLSRVTPLAVGIAVAIGQSANTNFFSCLQTNSGRLFFASAALASIVLFGPAHGSGIKLTSLFPWYPLVAVSLGGLLIACISNQFFKRILSAKWMQTVGRYSYSLYLAHFPILFVTRPVNWTLIHDPILRHLLWAAISFTLTFFVGTIIYKCIEQPLNQLRQRFH